MNIIFGEAFGTIPDKYTVLELDQFRLPPDAKVVTAYCVIENVPLEEFPTLEAYKKLHNECVSNYRKRQWNYCLQALEKLQGRWNCEVDSFYHELQQRINNLKDQELSNDWDGILDRS